MAIYYCNHCDNYIDDDWHPGEPDPESDSFDMICPDCLEKWGEECAKLPLDITAKHDKLTK